MRILVTGSRDWADGWSIASALHGAVAEWFPIAAPVVVVHGGARGADALADSAARAAGWAVEVHRAKWALYGKAAGHLRNQEMVAAGADLCLAFIHNGSRGATHCAALADAACILVRKYSTWGPSAATSPGSFSPHF